MITGNLRLVVIVFILFLFILIVYLLRKRKLSTKYAIVWFLAFIVMRYNVLANEITLLIEEVSILKKELEDKKWK